MDIMSYLQYSTEELTLNFNKFAGLGYASYHTWVDSIVPQPKTVAESHCFNTYVDHRSSHTGCW